MTPYNVLFNRDDTAKTVEEVKNSIGKFEYSDASSDIIGQSWKLDSNGSVFIQCTARILTNFGMTRSGPFKGIKISKNGHVTGDAILVDCWKAVGNRVFEIHKSVLAAGESKRGRYLLDISASERKELIENIWSITKQLLPFSMGGTTFGLVGASKILFAVLPEIVLPVDNDMWLRVFKTVDLGDVLKHMVSEIQAWEGDTGKRLNEMDSDKMLTTLPSVYNVMTMSARSKKVKKSKQTP
jgi:hypothetical protein